MYRNRKKTNRNVNLDHFYNKSEIRLATVVLILSNHMCNIFWDKSRLKRVCWLLFFFLLWRHWTLNTKSETVILRVAMIKFWGKQKLLFTSTNLNCSDYSKYSVFPKRIFRFLCLDSKIRRRLSFFPSLCMLWITSHLSK